MSSFIHKSLVATAVAGTLIGLTAGPASAAEPSMKVRVCNQTPNNKNVYAAQLEGANQNGREVTSPKFTVGTYRACHTLEGFWWKIGGSAVFEYSTDTKSLQRIFRTISGSDGGTFTINLDNVE